MHALAFSPAGNMLVSGSFDEAVTLWDVRSGRPMRVLPAHADPVAGVDVVRDGTLVASGAGDGLVRIWDAGTGQCLRTLGHDGSDGDVDMGDNRRPAVGAVRFSPNGRFVLVWTLDGCVRLWDYVSGRCVKTYQGHANARYSLAGGFAVYGGGAAAAGREGAGGGGERGNGVRPTAPTTTTSPKSQSQSQPQPPTGTAATTAAATPPTPPVAAAVVSGSEDGAILFWDVITKIVLQRITDAHADTVLGVDLFDTVSASASASASSSKGSVGGGRRMMVSCSLDRTVRVWEEDEGGGNGDGDEMETGRGG